LLVCVATFALCVLCKKRSDGIKAKTPLQLRHNREIPSEVELEQDEVFKEDKELSNNYCRNPSISGMSMIMKAPADMKAVSQIHGSNTHVFKGNNQISLPDDDDADVSDEDNEASQGVVGMASFKPGFGGGYAVGGDRKSVGVIV